MIVENIDYKGYSIAIEYDEIPMNPRTEWDNLTEIHCCSSRYFLGEHNHKNWRDLNDAVKEAEKQNDFIMTVYGYIHGGVCLSVESFYGRIPAGHARFDSGVCGVIIIRREKMLREFGKKRWTPKLKRRAERICKSDIKIFNAYLSGEVYAFVTDDDCCSGFYDIEACIAEAKCSIDSLIEDN